MSTVAEAADAGGHASNIVLTRGVRTTGSQLTHTVFMSALTRVANSTKVGGPGMHAFFFRLQKYTAMTVTSTVAVAIL